MNSETNTDLANIMFSQDEIETIKDIINDWGFDYCLQANYDKVKALAQRLGVERYIP
jgi:hypothetical protein